MNRKHLLLCVSLSLAGCYDDTTMAGGDTDSGTAGEDGSGGSTAGDDDSGGPADPPAEVNLVPEAVSRRLS